MVVLRFKPLSHYFLKPGAFDDISNRRVQVGPAECLSKMAIQKISNSPGARVAVVSTLMYSTAFS